MCNNKTCRLPHIDRAGQRRKAAAFNHTATDSSNLAKADSDLSSEEDYDEIDSDDVDSDSMEEIINAEVSSSGDPDISKQQDFIQF